MSVGQFTKVGLQKGDMNKLWRIWNRKDCNLLFNLPAHVFLSSSAFVRSLHFNGLRPVCCCVTRIFSPPPPPFPFFLPVSLSASTIHDVQRQQRVRLHAITVEEREVNKKGGKGGQREQRHLNITIT